MPLPMAGGALPKGWPIPFLFDAAEILLGAMMTRISPLGPALCALGSRPCSSGSVRA